jgi:protoheme IX farnesyltransferase
VYKLRLYWSLTKSLQTGLLLSTGLAGFMTCRCPVMHFPTLLGLTISLYLSIAGSTVINMWFDRDLDERMTRTCARPLAAGKVTAGETLRLGLVLSALGISMAGWLNPLYGLVVSAGLFFDVVVYTMWLKRRTPWAILLGGIAGGMPILAGRALGSGRIDLIGILLALTIVFWIPTHIMTFHIRYHSDYQKADIPTFPSEYGFQTTRIIIAVSSLAEAFTIGLASYYLSMSWGYLRLLAVLTGGLIGLAIGSLTQPSERLNLGLFKYASVYMLSSMILLMIQAI